MHKSNLFFISLGPGDPELITLKSLRQLERSDMIFCPGTHTLSGTFRSRSKEILDQLGIDERKVIVFNVPMSKQRDAAHIAYNEIAYKLMEIYREHNDSKIISVVAEGDCGFYSSTHYISEILMQEGVEVNHIAGVPAFLACAAAVNLHITKQEETLEVIPGIVTEEQLLRNLKEKKTIVIMKVSLSEAVLKAFLTAHPQYSYSYFENVGLDNEYSTTNSAEIQARKIPYFSIMIIKNEE